MSGSAIERARRVADRALDNLEAFYSRPLAWAAWIVTSLYLAYGGGAAMFWVHAIHRGEAGPAISDLSHWFLDSTLGFLALTPAVFFLLPLALWAARSVTRGSLGMRTGGFVVLVGTTFGVVTVPGPLMHNLLVGGGTRLGDLAERVFGLDPSVAARNAVAVEHSALSESLVQLFVGVPVYLLAAAAALLTVRLFVQVRRRAG